MLNYPGGPVVIQREARGSKSEKEMKGQKQGLGDVVPGRGPQAKEQG